MTSNSWATIREALHLWWLDRPFLGKLLVSILIILVATSVTLIATSRIKVIELDYHFEKNEAVFSLKNISNITLTDVNFKIQNSVLENVMFNGHPYLKKPVPFDQKDFVWDIDPM